MVGQLSGLKMRVLSAVIILPALLAVVWKGGVLFKILLVLAAGRGLYEWVRLAAQTRYRYALIPLGVLYIGCAFYIFYFIRMGLPSPGPALLFLALLFSSDIAAYAAGKTIGGPKITPTISPNKTWAGFVAALLTPGVLIVIILAFYSGRPPDFDTYCLVMFASAMLVGFAGQAGDLLISVLKRAAKTKDAGSIIPGHGGLLDRLDSMMLAGMVYYALLYVIGAAFVS